MKLESTPYDSGVDPKSTLKIGVVAHPAKSQLDSETLYTLIGQEVSYLGERYPIDIDCFAPVGENRSLCDQALRQASLKIFQISGGGVNVLQSTQDDESQSRLYREHFITSEEVEKHGILDLRGDFWQHLVFVVQPAFSWSQLSITELAFRNILAGLRVFTPFLHVVHSFGSKTNDRQRARNLAYHRVYPSSSYEFCYSIRYFELNGRGRGNPWSLRQTGVYQKCLANKQSAWLLLNFSSYVNDRMSAALGEKSTSIHGSCGAKPLLPHFFLISAATRNWDPYIENLRHQVIILEEKAYSFRINEVYLVDYELLFSDVQRIMSLSDTLATATSIIRGQRDILSKLNDLYKSLEKRRPGRCNCDTTSVLAMLGADLQHSYEAVMVLARTALKIMQLLSAILTTRANDNLLVTTSTIQISIAELQQQSRQNVLDTSHLLQTTKEGQRDAAVIKTLTQTATMFLPASLIASLFSSTIVNDTGNISSVALYFAITFPLLLVTLLLVIILDKGLPRATWLRRFL
ncbi:uncharacterized protein PAC_18698 [Phialocephala subalpina]|uniref:CorA-like transporter domain-containing protein n=1 Tax=Phialocephala subalpina TaxID=576137 RepID=A0A1L7XUT7_9HELO|nr:uncharacterized protein PAC_18698 [Phialocephala subalpina]